jgi:hypothetical protein
MVTHLAATFKYALEGFRNSAGKEATRATMLGAVEASFDLAADMVSATVGSSGCTLIFMFVLAGLETKCGA